MFRLGDQCKPQINSSYVLGISTDTNTLWVTVLIRPIGSLRGKLDHIYTVDTVQTCRGHRGQPLVELQWGEVWEVSDSQWREVRVVSCQAQTESCHPWLLHESWRSMPCFEILVGMVVSCFFILLGGYWFEEMKENRRQGWYISSQSAWQHSDPIRGQWWASHSSQQPSNSPPHLPSPVLIPGHGQTLLVDH